MDTMYNNGEYLEINTTDSIKYRGYFHSKNKSAGKFTLYNVTEFPKENFMDLHDFLMSDIKQVERIEKNHDIDKSNKNDKCTQFILINQYDNKYIEAISDLLENKTIAVGTTGAEMGRKCKLSILAISTLKNIYIFDIQALQENAFKHGLRNVLQNENIVKIIHNSRKLSDCLYHKHNVDLKNVFDTQAADVLIQNRIKGVCPDEVRTLTDCLNTYLGCTNYNIVEKIDIVALAERPLSTKIKDNVSNNIACLHQLHKQMLEEIMKPFIKGFDFYLNCQKQSNDSEAWHLCSQDKKVPKNFIETIQNM